MGQRIPAKVAPPVEPTRHFYAEAVNTRDDNLVNPVLRAHLASILKLCLREAKSKAQRDRVNVALKKGTTRDDGPMSVELAIDCIRQAATGLNYAQEQGVIHRDIKPGNLMLDQEGVLKVLDLGLAGVDESFRLCRQSSFKGKSADANAGSPAKSELTADGTVLGTVSYMAPEQSLDARKADTRADIYSLGCTLHYLLIGEAPYKGDTIFQIFTNHREGLIPRLRESRPDVPESVEAVIQKMLAKSPDDRYQSMGELISAIDVCDIAPPPKSTYARRSNSADSMRTETGDLGSTVTIAPRDASPTKSGNSNGWFGLFACIIFCLALGGGYWWWETAANDEDSAQGTNPGFQVVGETPKEEDMSVIDLLATGEWEWSVPQNLGAVINPSVREKGPTISADGLTLVFNSDRETSDGQSGIAQAWISTRDAIDADWRKPRPLPLKGEFFCNEPELTANGRLLYYFRHAKSDDDLGIFVSHRHAEEPFSIGSVLKESVNSQYAEVGPRYRRTQAS